MKKKTIKILALLGIMAMVLCGCQKEEEVTVDPNMEQPVLGVDAEGYGGFTYLQAYSFGEQGANSVLYLPKDDAAYVGETCMICKTEGVEVTLNYEPTYSEEIAAKPLKYKLDSTLGIEYSDLYAEDYKDLVLSEIDKLGDNAVVADVSYLVLDDVQKTYIGYWGYYYLVELEDGREFRAIIKVQSDLESANTMTVLEELEKYFAIEIPYESGMLQAKIDGYNPSDKEAARLEGTVVQLGVLDVVLPKFWIRNEIAEEAAQTAIATTEYERVEVYAETETAQDLDFNMYIMLAEAPAEGSAAELGSLNKEEIQVLERVYEEMFLQMYPGINVETDVIESDLGFVVEMDMSGLDGIDGIAYMIARGDKAYMIMGTCLESNAEDAKEIREIMREVIANTEVR